MAGSNRRVKDRTRPSPRASDVVAVSLIVVSAVVVDPFGFQTFLPLRYAFTVAALLGATIIMWRRGISLPRHRIVRVVIVAFLGLLFISALQSRAPVVAILGASGRQLGWLAWVLFAVAFVAGLSLFDRSERRRVETALVLGFGSAIIGVGAVAALEIVGAPLVTVNQQFGSRLQASFGNPAVLGAFTVLALPVVAGGLVAKRLPVLTGIATAIGAVLLVLSGSRGAWIGIAIAAAFVAASSGYRRSELTLVRLAVVVVAIVALVGITALTGRWGTAGSAIEGRFATWQVAGTVVAGHPIVGVGPEGFATAFAEAVGDDYVIRYTRDDTVDRAHNGVLEVATAAGIPATILYLALITAALVVAWRAAADGDAMRPVIAGAAAGVVGYLVQQQVFFQLAALDLSFWFVVGLLAVSAGLASSRRSMPVAAIVMCVVVAAAGIYAAVGVYADRQDREALRSGDAAIAMSRLERAAALRPSDDIHAIIAAAVSGEVGDPRLNERTGRIVDGALAIDPTSGTLILERSALLVDAYEMSGASSALDEAQIDLEELVSRDETNGEAFLRLGAIAYYKGHYDVARSRWMRAAYLMPHRREPTDNLSVLEGNSG